MTLLRLLCGVLLLAGCQVYCQHKAKVLAVGGCDRNGWCGVATDNGPAVAWYPVVGQPAMVYRPCQAKE